MHPMRSLIEVFALFLKDLRIHPTNKFSLVLISKEVSVLTITLRKKKVFYSQKFQKIFLVDP